ncbi:MAG: hypothetical protein ACU837_09330 [Gammaproteobacteria bacterium]
MSIAPAFSPPAIPSGCTFTVSGRKKIPGDFILDFLEREFPFLPLPQVDSVFGFVEACSLYGGRAFSQPELSLRDVTTLRDCCIGLRLPLSNHHVSREEYERYGEFLDRYHEAGNSVIVVRDELAQWIREDFPRYEIEASVIKDVDTHDKLQRALELYDTVVLPMRLNLDPDFLLRIREKKRITLFANGGCALNCPSKICYTSFSKANKFTGEATACSFSLKPRELFGMQVFDLPALAALGFSRFKLLRMQEHGLTGF